MTLRLQSVKGAVLGVWYRALGLGGFTGSGFRVQSLECLRSSDFCCSGLGGVSGSGVGGALGFGCSRLGGVQV